MTTEPLSLDQARAVLRDQPFSVLLGTELVRFGDGHATLGVEMRAELHQQHGFAHGGVVSYLADNAITFAAGSVAGPAVLTSAMQINYLAGARGHRLEAVASVVDGGRRLITVRCDVFDHRADRPYLCAIAQGTAVRMERPPQARDGESS
jgi:uncharacterized protein (TIGR00369 family)